jgi:hypothetical protein
MNRILPLATILAATALFAAAIGLSSSAAADAASPGAIVAQAAPGSLAPQAAPTPGAPPAAKSTGRPMPRRMSSTELVDARISTLHQSLRITPAQEVDWGKVAQAMRDNAGAVEAIAKERQQNLKSMNAVDNLKSYQLLAAAQAEGMKKVDAAFGVLYAEMDDDQKKNADAVFRNERDMPRQRGK